MILIVFLYALLALTFVLAKGAVTISSPLFFIAIRMLIAGAILLLLTAIWKKKIFPSKKDAPFFLLTAVLHIYIPFAGEFWSLQFLDALKVNFVYALTPFFALFLEFLIHKRQPSLRLIAGISCGFLSLMILLFLQNQDTSVRSLFLFSYAECILMFSVISATAAWICIKRLMSQGYSTAMINGWSMVVGGAFCLINALIFETIFVANQIQFFSYMLALILLSNVFIYNMYSILLKDYSLTLLSTAGFLSPLFGILFEVVLTQRAPHVGYFFALGGIVLGLQLVAQEE
jgi:drug/metabolite transporter (DMT)-like permease